MEKINENFCKSLIRMAECCLKWHKHINNNEVWISSQVGRNIVYQELKKRWEDIDKIFKKVKIEPNLPSAMDQIKLITADIGFNSEKALKTKIEEVK